MSLQPSGPPNLHAGGDKWDLKRMLTLEEAEESVREWGQHLYSNFPSAVITASLDYWDGATGGEWPPGRSHAAHRLYREFKELIKQPNYKETNKIRSNYKLARSLVTPVYRLPDEIFVQIILLLPPNFLKMTPYKYETLLGVCRQWNDCLRRLPTIWSTLKLHMWTNSEYVRSFLARGKDQALKVRIDVSDDLTVSSEYMRPYEALGMAVESADRWQELDIQCPDPINQDSLPHYFENFLSKLTLTVRRLTVLALFDARSTAFLLQQPNHTPIWSGLKLLEISLSQAHAAPSADILPHLTTVESLSLSGVLLPEYDPNTPLPLVQTLRSLHLTGVSIKWMSGREFVNLQRCNIQNPHERHTVLTKATILPVCYTLYYGAHSLSSVKGFIVPHIQNLVLDIGRLQVQDATVFKDLSIRYDLLRSLSLTIRYPTQDLLSTLYMLPALNTLQIHLPRPQGLGWKFFSAFIMGPCRPRVNEKHCKDWWCIVLRSTSEEHRAAICPGLKHFKVRYGRWLRSTETDRVMPIFWAIAHSRRAANDPLEQFEVTVVDTHYLRVLGGYTSLDQSDWPHLPCKAAWKALENSVQHHTIQLENVDDRVPHFLAHYPFSPFLASITRLTISINQPQTFFEPLDILRYCKRLVILELEGITLPLYSEDTDLPLVHTLRKMILVHTSIGWMSGRTFTALKECRVLVADHDPRNELRMMHFPVCALLEYVNRPELLNLLAKFQVPRLRSLVVGSFALESPWYPPGESRAVHSWSLRFKFPSWWGALADELESISSLKVIGSQLSWPHQTTKRGLEMYTLAGMDPAYADD